MLQIIVIVISFLLTIVIGGRIAQTRQQASWVAQQRFSGEEKEYFELKSLCDEIAASLGSRIYAMRRVALQLAAYAQHGKFDKSSITEYREAIKTWNQNLSSYYVRLSQLKLSRYRYRLESTLHNPMQHQSNSIDNYIQKMEHGLSITGLVDITRKLDLINAISLKFNESLLGEVHRLRVKIYFPERITFRQDTMHKFSTWQLIKAIFVLDVNRISIIRSPLDS